jgi:sec-independent protein translocase protein TatB
MFDITSSKLLILGIVALLVIGPKDLPALLRTIGKYVGIIKRQAAEFRAQFDEAMRESELADLRKDVEALGREAEQSMRAAEQSVEKDWAQAQASVTTAVDGAQPAPTAPLSAEAEPAGEVAASALNGSAGHAAPAAVENAKLSPETERPADAVTPQGEPQVEKSGA